MQCSRCGFENADTKTYCSQCGTVLHSFTSYSAQMNYNIQLAPPEYSSEYGTQSQAFSYQKLSLSRRITVLRVVRSILYFLAVFVAGFGLFGSFISFGNAQLMAGLGIFFWLGLIVASVVIFFRVQHRIPRMRWVQFIWWILGATVGAIMALVLEFSFTNITKDPLGSFIFGGIILLYGLLLAGIALW
jgi:zinc-ribbon domain